MNHPARFDRESSLAQTFVRLADTLVREFDVSDLFDRLTSACVELFGAATAGLMLADSGGRLQLMASSNAAMRTLEELEVRSGEGPCLDAYANRRAISVDLREALATGRWPRFTAQALETGFTRVQALPMRLRDDTIGALNVFHTGTEPIDTGHSALAQALADIATIAILQHRALSNSQELAVHLQIALNDRIVIEQAKGLLAERGRLDVDEAFLLLRDYCRSFRLPLTRTARDLVQGRRGGEEILAFRRPR